MTFSLLAVPLDLSPSPPCVERKERESGMSLLSHFDFDIGVRKRQAICQVCEQAITVPCAVS